MRILIVDDYRSHGESFAELLQSRGHEAMYAERFIDAEWLLGLFRFDLAFLDFDMPGLTGPALARKIAERYPEVHSVILSAHVPDGARRLELGELPFLEKPVPAALLFDLIEKLERARAGSALMRRPVFSVKKYE
jgi:DNA-binding NtrC family response regulator